MKLKTMLRELKDNWFTKKEFAARKKRRQIAKKSRLRNLRGW